MVTRVIVRLMIVSVFVFLTCALAIAGGPVCKPVGCGPMMAPPPPMCGPMPLCGPAPCPPMAPCGPQPVCGPPCPPAKCKESPLYKICTGTTMLVSGVISLPFKLVDCLIEGVKAPFRCGPTRLECAPAPCGPPPCMPAPCAPAPQVCAPPPCGPMMGCGPGMPVPMGYGKQRSKRFVPFAAENSGSALLAGHPDVFFGNLW